MFEELVKAIKNNDTKNAKDLIEKMSVKDLNQIDTDGRNAFHLAVIKRNIELVKILYLKCDADIKAAHDSFGNTARHYADQTEDFILKSLIFKYNHPYNTDSPLSSEETSLIGANNLVEAST